MRTFGEFEFWFASIEVAAIVAFIVIALVYVLTGGGVGQLTGEGGFTPEGGVAILSGIVIVSMALVEKVRSQLYLGLLSVAVVLVAYFIKQRFASSAPPSGRFERSERALVSVR